MTPPPKKKRFKSPFQSNCCGYYCPPPAPAAAPCSLFGPRLSQVIRRSKKGGVWEEYSLRLPEQNVS